MWIITGICSFAGVIIAIQMAVNGFVINKLDDLTIKVARMETKLDLHMYQTQTARLSAFTNSLTTAKPALTCPIDP